MIMEPEPAAVPTRLDFVPSNFTCGDDAGGDGSPAVALFLAMKMRWKLIYDPTLRNIPTLPLLAHPTPFFFVTGRL